MAEPINFDELVVVLGPNCSLRPENMTDGFIFYRFSRVEILKRFKTIDGKYVGGKELFSKGCDKVLSLT
ncbi:MAG: hypothetical protein KAW92_14440 [Candidatus Cloacimonetes bacterium]|nr:hypothetical protein [Candidatus Cloacimonadota bacterium]